MKKPVTVTRGSLLYAIAAILLVNFTVSGLSVAYTSHQRKESDKRWCALFTALDRPVPNTIQDPEQRERTRQTVALIHGLREDHGCI